MYIFQASKAEILVNGSVSLLKLPRGFDFDGVNKESYNTKIISVAFVEVFETIYT